MEIMVAKPLYIEEVVKVVKNVERRYSEKKSVEEAHTGALNVKNNWSLKRVHKGPFLIFYLALSYFLRGLPPKYLRR